MVVAEEYRSRETRLVGFPDSLDTCRIRPSFEVLKRMPVSLNGLQQDTFVSAFIFLVPALFTFCRCDVRLFAFSS